MEWSAHMRESGKFLLVEFEEFLALESGLRLKESGIPLTTGIQHPRFHRHKIGGQFLESGILSVEFKIQDCLVLPYIGREWAGE